MLPEVDFRSTISVGASETSQGRHVAAAGSEAGSTKVGDLDDPVLVDEEVEGFEVAVDDLGLPVVETGNAPDRVGSGSEHTGPGDVLGGVEETVVEGALLAELEDDGLVGMERGAVEENNMRTAQCRNDGKLLFEFLKQFGLSFFLQNFDRDFLSSVCSSVDHGRRALAELVDQLEVIGVDLPRGL